MNQSDSPQSSAQACSIDGDAGHAKVAKSHSSRRRLFRQSTVTASILIIFVVLWGAWSYFGANVGDKTDETVLELDGFDLGPALPAVPAPVPAPSTTNVDMANSTIQTSFGLNEDSSLTDTGAQLMGTIEESESADKIDGPLWLSSPPDDSSTTR